jgi:ribulose-5-phosphate 4-epimerase/fuculose-1-phosphate aldolase
VSSDRAARAEGVGGAQPAAERHFKETIALGCRILGGEGFTRAAYGHVSLRLGDDLVAIKARGRNEQGLEFTTASDVVTIRMDGSLVEGGEGLVPPNESQIHLEVLRARPDVQSVVHIHPVEIVALGAVGRRLLPLYGAFSPAGLKLATKTLRYYPRSLLISTPELGREVALALGDGEACMLKGHGIVTVGATVEEGVLTAIALGELAQVNLLAASAGEPEPLDEREIADWDAFFAKYPNRVFTGRTDTGEPAEWHYYAKRDARRRGQQHG